MTNPDLTELLAVLRSPQARPLIREAGWAAGVCVVIIVLASLLIPRVAYAAYLAVGVFFAATLTGVFVSLLESETDQRLIHSPVLRRWLAAFASVVAILAAVILV